MSVGQRALALPRLLGLARSLGAEFEDLPLETVAAAIVRAAAGVPAEVQHDVPESLRRVELAARADLSALTEAVTGEVVDLCPARAAVQVAG